jgi:hypothetical protein
MINVAFDHVWRRLFLFGCGISLVNCWSRTVAFALSNTFHPTALPYSSAWCAHDGQDEAEQSQHGPQMLGESFG